MKKNRLAIVLFILLVICDQVTKFLITSYIENGAQLEFFKFITLTNINNTGYIFKTGMLKTIMQIIIPLIALSALAISLFSKAKYTKTQRFLMWALLAGGMGNIIDRTFRSKGVIDFIYIDALPMLPVFNIADLTVALSVTFMILSLIIQDRSLK